jgi:hypothetical protein
MTSAAPIERSHTSRTNRTEEPRGAADVRRTLLALLASAMGVLPLCELISDI